MTNKTLNLIQVLRDHVRLQPDQIAYQFLQQGEAISDSLSYAQLDQRARIIAVHLQQHQVSGRPVLLLYPAGLEYLCAFMGCLYAGAIAVPAYPPSRHHVKRVNAIIGDANPKVVLCDSELSLKLVQLEAIIPSLRNIPKVVNDTLNQNSASDWLMPDINTDNLAFLQYTSGSTGNPKGVMISHGNLMANLASLSSVFQHPDRAPYVSWLPLYHDMGLIGVSLRALYIGSPAILMSPTAFMEKPVRWLRAISRYRAHYSGGPNFAYDLCVNKVTPEQCQGLDLSHWRIAFNGAEPIRAKTLEKFYNTFKPFGFKKNAFWSCYGMAETTLFISGSRDGQSPETKYFDADALACRQAHIVEQPKDQTTSLVSCGTTRQDETLSIVNPNNGQACKNNEVGEIWVQGPSVAQGYWRKPQLTEKAFKATLKNDDKNHFFRTGDLGFIHQGQLYHAGRLKDLIIIRGLNLYPQDIEQVIDEQIEAVRVGASAAFSFDSEEGETVVIVCELTRQTYKLNIDLQQKTAGQIRRVLSQSFELQPWAVILVAPTTVPKTSSGKIMRSACKQQWLEGRLRIVLEDKPQEQEQEQEQIQSQHPVNQEHILLKQMLDQSNTLQKQTLMLQFLHVYLATLLNCTADQIDDRSSLVELGLDSLRHVELKHVLDTLLQRDIPFQDLMGDFSLALLTKRLAEQDSPVADLTELPEQAIQTDKTPLSEGQKAIWFVHQQQAQSIAYNIHLALRIHSKVHSKLLQKSLEVIMLRHPALRTSYGENDGIPYQTINTEIADFFAVIDAKNWTPHLTQQAVHSIITTPFDLETGKVFRVRLLIQDDSSCILLLCAHHIALDFWSLSLIVQQLGDLYLAKAESSHLTEMNSGALYADFVRWQQTMLSHDAESHWRYWSQQLSGDLIQLTLPTDSPRPKEQHFLGASQALDISANTTASLKAFSQQHQTTLFITLLSAFSALLYRYSEQQDMLIGIPTSGRVQKRFANTIGYFVNPVAMRFKPHGALPFYQLVEQTRANMLGALEHQGFPFSTVVERLNPEREADSWPLYQLAFTLQTPQLTDQQDLAGLALGESGFNMRWGGLDVESFAVDKRIENFDLKLIMAETRDGLSASFQFNSELFEASTIRIMADHFGQLLQSIVERPEQALRDLKILSKDELRQQMANTPQDKPVLADCVHKAFEHQAQIQPQALAIQSTNALLTYSELDERSNQLARCLQVAGACPESIIALCLPRGTDFVVATLAVLKAGASYLPLDSLHPSARIQDMLTDAGVLAIISCEEFSQNFMAIDCQTILLDRDKIMLDTYPGTPISTQLKLDNTAYLIYTSGSSGKPKGVSVSHRALINLVSWHQQEYQLSSNDRASQIAGLGFDASVWEIWPYLTAGASLHIIDDNIRLNPESLLNWLTQQQISHCFLPTPLAEVVLQTPWPKNISLKALLTGGDRLGKITEKQQTVSLYNHYGPTENTVVASFTKVDWQDKRLPAIGHAIDNVQLYILDASLNPVPSGCEGDLYIAGNSLARGYHDQPGLTAERFIPNPFNDIPGTRMYLSGDRARYRKGGEIEFCGRNDQQIKARGFRIEPAEIEYWLEQMQGIKTSTVLMQANGTDGQQLTAYIVPTENQLSFVDVTAEMQSAHIQRWTEFFDNSYQAPSEGTDNTCLNSSYTDSPIPANEMQQCIDHSVATIVANKPHRVLEIGCGTGLLLTQIAKQCDSYFATDISQTALNQLTAVVDRAGINQVTLKCQPANAELANLNFDTVIVNSVTQYFPNIDYFIQMLDQLLPTIAPEGRIFIGDIRNHSQLKLFHTDVQSYRAKSTLPVAELIKTIAISENTDHELLIAPDFFIALKQRYSRINHVEIHHKRGNYDNELSRYHYDVVLHITSHCQAQKPNWVEWAEFADIDRLRQQLATQHPELLGIRGIPNSRLNHVVELNKALGNSQQMATKNVATLRNQLEKIPVTGIDPYVLELLAEKLGYHIDLLVSEHSSRGVFNVILRDKTSNINNAVLDSNWAVASTEDYSAFTNDPLHTQKLNSWVPLLRESLNQHLPDFMVPQAFVFLDHMPINANGKLDRKALPLPDASHSDGQHIEATTPTERILSDIWQQLLGVASIGIQDNFFELGGDSILSIQVVSRARSANIIINSRHIFEHQTIEKLAKEIDRLKQPETPVSEGQNNALATLYSTEQYRVLAERFGDIDAIYPLTPLQMGLWFQNQFDTEQSVYIEQLCLLLQGDLNVEALKTAWHFVQTRHAVLRTAFDWLDAEQAVQIVVKAEQLELPFYQMNWRTFNANTQDAQLKSFLAQDYAQGFNSSQAPLMRISLIRISDQQYHMVWTHHHLLLDGWSIPILLTEFFEAYQHFALDQVPDFPQLPAYSHYINWLIQRDKGHAKRYWQKTLSGFDQPLFLQDPRIENASSGTQSVQRSDFVWDKHFTEQLQDFCRHQHITLNTLLQGAWALLLSSHTSRNDVLFGIVDAGRQHPLESIENMVGLLINSLPLRIKLNPERRADEWLQALQIQTLELGEYSYSPLPDIQRWSDCEAQAPLFDILIAFENYPLAGIKDKRYAEVSIANVTHQDQTHYALTLVIKPAENLSFSMSYDNQRFSASGIKTLAQHLKTLVSELMANSQQQLAMFSPVDQQERAMLEDFSQIKSSHSAEKTLVECFQQQVSLQGDAPALVFENQTLSYQELETQANQLAQAISQQGIQAGDRVALSLERSIHSAVAILAVLKAGATYVPLDPDYPIQRQIYTINDASVSLLIVDKEQRWHQDLAVAVLALDTLDFEQFENQAPTVNIDSKWPAYIIYTSGSTGKPKGVSVSHTQVMRLFSACAEHVDFKSTDVWTLFHSSAFDFSVWELWGALLHGASCVVVPYWVSRSAKDFQQLIKDQKVTILSQTPSAFYQLQKEILSLKSPALDLRYILFGGEALDPAKLAPWFEQLGDSKTQLINMYGITETTVHVTAHRLFQQDSKTSASNIGRPLNDLSTWVLDSHGQAVPFGVIGELYVGGAGVSQGYVGRASLNAERFIPDPFSNKSGARLYRTGDLVRYCEDGTLEYHGRCDKQIKLHGHRIETGEIEHALLQHPAVDSSAVIIAQNEQQASAQLIAYWVGEQTDSALLKAELEQQLPSHMVPQHFIYLDTLPLTINGKLDYQALPAPDQPILTENVSAETEVESQLLNIWCELLKLEKIGVSDNFFALGGDSILSMQVVNRAQQQGIKITPKQLFEHQDIRSLARVAEHMEASQFAVSTKMSGIVPFTPIQQWFFEQPLKNFNHWNQTLLLAMPQARDAELLQRALIAVTEHHDSFRLRYYQQQGSWHQAYQQQAEPASFEIIDLSASDKFQQQQLMASRCQSAQQNLDIEHDPVFRALYFRCAPLQSDQLLLCAHHLIVDGVSWRIILEDIELAYQQLSDHSEIKLPQKTHSFNQWSEQLIAYTASETLQNQRNYWLGLPWGSVTALAYDQPLADNREDEQAFVKGQLTAHETQDLLKKIPTVYSTQINDLLLTALVKCLLPDTGGSVMHIDIEGHGREPLFADLDISNTVGWFTSQYPVLLSLSGLGMGEDIKRVKELLRAIPQQGIGFGLLRHLDKAEKSEQFSNLPKASLCFNYLGQFDASWADSSPLFASTDSVASQIGNQHAGNNPRYYDIDINVIVVGGELLIHWSYSPRYSKQRIEKLADSYLHALRDLIAHCLSPTAGGFSPSDFPLADQLDQQALDQLLKGL